MDKVNLIIVATPNPAEKAALDHYLESMHQLYQKVEAQPVAKYKISEALIGTQNPHLVSVMEFPNQEAVNQVFQGEAYQQLLPYREKAFVKVEAYVGQT